MEHKRKISLSQYHEEGGSFLFIDSEIFDDFDAYLDDIRNWSEDGLKKYQLPIIYGGTVEKIRIYPEDIIEDLEERDEAYEDYEVDAAAKDFIRAFAKEYNERYADESVWKDEDSIIVLNEEEATKIRTAIFKALENLQKGTNMNTKEIKLSELKPGDIFKFAGLRWVKLEETEKGTKVIAADKAEDQAFDTEDRNNWNESTVREYLNNDVISPLEWVSESGGEKIELPNSYDMRRLANESKELCAGLFDELGKEKGMAAYDKLHSLIKKLLELDGILLKEMKDAEEGNKTHKKELRT